MPQSLPTLHHDVIGHAVAAEGVVDGAGVVAPVLPPHALHLEVRLEPEHASPAAGIPRPGDRVNRNLKRNLMDANIKTCDKFPVNFSVETFKLG